MLFSGFKTKESSLLMGRIILPAIIIIFLVIMAFPFLFLIKLSMQPTRDALMIPIKFFPSSIKLSNFIEITRVFPVLSQFLNSLIFAGFGSILAVSTGTIAAYALAKLRLPGTGFLVLFFISTILIPPELRVIPLYTLIAKMGLVDTWGAMLLPVAATGFSIFFLYQFMLNIPDNLLEAARIDGAHEFTTLIRVVLPLSSSAVGTMILSTFIFRWREFIWPFIVTKGSVTTLVIGLTQYSKGGEYIIKWNLIGAGAMYLFIPTLLLFLGLRRYILMAFSLDMK